MAALIFFGMACGSGNALPTAAPTPVYDYESLIADLGNAETEFDERATFSVGARDVAISGAISAVRSRSTSSQMSKLPIHKQVASHSMATRSRCRWAEI
ncbi:MAG: hypothetical protein IIC92_10665 [Chloroflexi bacterium]|nr:hypothetical protein [Chloroflexota bacterium]